MPTPVLRHKHLRLDQAKLDKVKRILQADTDTEALDRAMGVVLAEDEIQAALRRVRGKGHLRRVFD